LAGVRFSASGGVDWRRQSELQSGHSQLPATQLDPIGPRNAELAAQPCIHSGSECERDEREINLPLCGVDPSRNDVRSDLACRTATGERHSRSGYPQALAHDPEKCTRFSDKIMRLKQNMERASISKKSDRALSRSLRRLHVALRSVGAADRRHKFNRRRPNEAAMRARRVFLPATKPHWIRDGCRLPLTRTRARSSRNPHHR
jgi:hypothetical protein